MRDLLLVVARCLLFDPEDTNRSAACEVIRDHGNRRDYRAAILATQDGLLGCQSQRI